VVRTNAHPTSHRGRTPEPSFSALLNDSPFSCLSRLFALSVRNRRLLAQSKTLILSTQAAAAASLLLLVIFFLPLFVITLFSVSHSAQPEG